MHTIFAISLLLYANAQDDILTTGTKSSTAVMEKLSLSNGTSYKNETVIAKNHIPQETTTIVSLVLNSEDVRGNTEHIIRGSSSILYQTNNRSKDATAIMEKVSLPEVISTKNETDAGKNRDSHETITNTTSTLKDEDVWDKIKHVFEESTPVINETRTITNETEINIRSISYGKGSGGENNLVADFNTTKATTLATPDSKEEEEERCEVWSGENGICVKYYLCVEILGDTGLIDLHIPPPCSSFFDVCCSLNQTTKTTPPPQDNKNTKNGSNCGRRNPSGVGFSLAGDSDRYANFGEFPWMVAVLSIRNESKSDNASQSDSQESVVYLGGGSLINPSVVLSAAHLYNTSGGLRIRAGEWDTQTTREIYQHQERDVQHVLLHENYKKSNLYYDVALLFLSTPVEMAPHVGTACLPPAGALAAPGAQCFASGWGKNIFGKQGYYSVILKKVQLPVVEKAVCRELLDKTRLGRHFELHPSFMCAGGEIGVDTCTGDGGSPLVCPIDSESERYEQSGVVSWGIGCGEDRTPGVYADVGVVRDWIDREVRARGFDPATYTY